jgi:hypothetical protein
VSLYILLGLGALLGILLIGGLLRRLWEMHEERAIEKKWEERERLLDRRTTAAGRREALRRRSRRRERARAGRESARPSGRGRQFGR